MADKPKRNYKKEAEWAAQPAQVKRRMARNRARYAMEKAGKVHKGDGKEVDHKAFTKNKNAPLNNDPSNLRVVSRHVNRSKQPKRKGRG